MNMKGRIIVFSILGCPSCIRTKRYLDQLGLQYIDVNLDKNSEARQKVIELTGKKTVPQVFFNDKHIGGWDNLSNLVSISFFGFYLSCMQHNRMLTIVVAIVVYTYIKYILIEKGF